MAMYSIGQLAKQAGVNVETIRYYERQKLIAQPIKPAQGYRQYSSEVLTQVRFIKRAQHLGFTLAEIANLLVLSAADCRDVQHLAEHKLALVQAKKRDLARLEASLTQLVSACHHNTNEQHCPLIDSLQDELMSFMAWLRTLVQGLR